MKVGYPCTTWLPSVTSRWTAFVSAILIYKVLPERLFPLLREHSPKIKANSTLIPQHSNLKMKKNQTKKNSGKERHFPKDNLPVRLPIAAKQPLCVPVPEDT